MSEYILEMRNITKEFPGVKALDNVNFKVKRGEIHALVGENGAGKSTLMKILSGVYPYGTYKGDIIIDGEVKQFRNIKDSEKSGIAIIYQELTLVKYMTVGENIFLGEEPVKGGIIDWMKVYSETYRLLKELQINVNPYTKVMNLGIGHQQMVEIAKALSKKARILILDEPTSALTESETEHLLNILKDLKKNGVTCIYISHKLNEVFEIADSITVLRDGKTIMTDKKENFTENKVISLMVGRELTQRFPRAKHTPGEVVFEVKNYTVYDHEIPGKKIIDNVSFKARRGEILGIAGLMGAGRTELAASIFGAFKGRKEGEIYLNGKKIEINTPSDAIKHGIAYLSEDRKRFGLVTLMDVQENIALPNYDRLSKFSIINNNAKIKHAEKYVKELKIKTPTIRQRVANLSGGNQQKVVIAKWLMSDPKVLILDEPTRGIDVGAKFEIYNLMNKLVDMGVCVIMISSELPEILGMSDRILVIHEGKINGEFPIEEADQEKIMYCATGGK
ncbi:ABC transporter related protein [Thermoanaerobacter mathranii subsp. mathranii str. A3]|jgi:D-xylose transport system ATP-binding protein|uniref:Xylose import ATP-binding protein XylG n=4 Tax=Thermoanaerobacter TaxID=1754 RepID=XYLG_THEP3|nr:MULTISPECIES: xylose ABC transporter ATP-binding protein [Thermoanaerobacter]Q6VMN4.1 RecName: Full=Xylose import ATP-binding protein XylG [Thermoanaerobacter pseudethanolicus ATCC 33223]AAQ93072.1 xylose ABC-ATPase [Thermoanaerobacter ethanolicus]SFE13516.1 xylose ABC transporter ATP-binding protein [Thermoanaerobacter thermohydrosulfuricus]ADD01572.1 ABC transporter related protein [Thermoanaerobacter italicus Ab9]ADH60108.1 ABC transporter related protein [Thermoanaerobacter mathranii su